MVLRLKVNCFRCNSEVDANAVINSRSVNGEPRHECYSCYKKNKVDPLLPGDEAKVKRLYYCEKCRYQFKSFTPRCQLCSKPDYVVKGNPTVTDLI